MKNIIKLCGIMTLITGSMVVGLFALTFAACGNSGGGGTGGGGGGDSGVLTIIDIPNEYNNNYMWVEGEDDTIMLMGVESYDDKTNTYKYSKILNGTVKIPMWVSDSSGLIPETRYSGNHILSFEGGIYNNQYVNYGELTLEELIELNVFGILWFSVKFKNGSATVSWNDGNIFYY
jgi:hypothetical protein